MQQLRVSILKNNNTFQETAITQTMVGDDGTLINRNVSKQKDKEQTVANVSYVSAHMR